MDCWSDWCEMRRKQLNKILGQLFELSHWPQPWAWPWSFKVIVWNSLISGMGRPIDMGRDGCESSSHDHNIGFCVTMVGWVNVPERKRGKVWYYIFRIIPTSPRGQSVKTTLSGTMLHKQGEWWIYHLRGRNHLTLDTAHRYISLNPNNGKPLLNMCTYYVDAARA